MKTDRHFKYNESGTGPVVIMLHGLFGAASNWVHTQKALSKRFRTIAMDLPYIELEKKCCNVDYFTQYVREFMEFKGIESANFMGNSLGGHVALNLAVKDGGIVESLILSGSSGLFERTFDKELQIHPTKAYLKKKIEEIFYDRSFATDEIVDWAYSLLLDNKIKIRVVRLSKSAKSYNMKDLLNHINCPTLLVWGRNDVITPRTVAYTFKENIKDSKLVFLDKCGHAPMMEHPEEFIRLSLIFLSHKNEKAFS